MDQKDPNNVPLAQDNDGSVPAEVIQQGFKEVQMELRAQGLVNKLEIIMVREVGVFMNGSGM